MFHFLVFILMFFLVAAVIALAVGVYVLRKGISMFRNAAGKVAGGRAHGAGGRRAGNGYGGGAWSTGRQSARQTVTDTRDEATANRRIFADNEGEYVDYVEKTD